MWSDSGHIFKTEPTGFLEVLDVKYERNRGSQGWLNDCCCEQ